MNGKKGILWFVVGVLVCALMVLCFIGGMKYYDKTHQEDTKEKQEKSEDSEEFKDLDLKDSLVKEAMGFMPYELCAGVYYKFTEKDVKIEDISNIDKFNMMLGLFSNDIFDTAQYDGDKKVELTEEKISKYFADLSFLNEFKKNYSTANVDDQKYNFVMPFNVEYKDGNFFFYAYPTGCTGPGEDGGMIETLSAKKNSKQLIITVMYAYETVVFKDDDFFYNFSVNEAAAKKKDYAQKNLVCGESPDGCDFGFDKSLYNKYDLVFDITDGNLRLQEINFKGK